MADKLVCRSWTPPRGSCDPGSGVRSRAPLWTHAAQTSCSQQNTDSPPLRRSPQCCCLTPALQRLTPSGGLERDSYKTVSNKTGSTLDDFKYFPSKCYLCCTSQIQHLMTGHTATSASSPRHWLSDRRTCVIARRADEQRSSPHLQSGKRGLSRAMLQCWNSLLPAEFPLQSCLSLKLLTAPKHS